MPDLKISQLTDGGAVQSTDQIPVNRGGANRRVTLAGFSGAIDITWADLLTAIGGSTLTPMAVYHITDAPDSSTTIDEAWVRAKDTNEIFPDGECLINAANITNRLAGIRFFMAGTTGSMISGVYDDKKNEIEAYALSLVPIGTSTANIDAWLDLLSAANQSVKIYSSVLVTAGVGNTIVDYSELFGSTLQISNGSNFEGVIFKGSVTLDNASNANIVHVLGGLVLDNGAILATGYVGIGKTLTMTSGETSVGFSTEGNTKLTQYAANATGDTALVDNADGVVYITDGSTDVTITMPAGLIDGQQMMFYFKQGSAAITWNGSPTDATTFAATAVAGQKIMAFWDAGATTWR